MTFAGSRGMFGCKGFRWQVVRIDYGGSFSDTVTYDG